MAKITVLLMVLAVSISQYHCRVPPRNQETDEASAPIETSLSKENAPAVNPAVERSPVDSSSSSINESPVSTDLDRPTARKPLVILFRQQPSISLFSNRSPNPFSPAFRPTLLDHSHFNNFQSSSIHDDPAIRLFSLLMGGNRGLRPIQPDSTETDASNESTSAESTEDSSRDVHPFERLFPNIFPISRFPLDDHDHDKEPTINNDDKTPVNYENKEKKVVTIGGRKFVKTTQVKKTRTDFGQFHSVISSYQPFDEKIHDENGNDKVKPDDSEVSSTVDKKDVAESSTPIDKKDVVESSTPVDKKDVVESSTPDDEKVDIVPLSSTTTTTSTTTTSTTTPTSVEKEETTSTESSPSDKSVTPDDDDDTTEDNKEEPEKLVSSTEGSSKENEIPDKNTEIKVDQMN